MRRRRAAVASQPSGFEGHALGRPDGKRRGEGVGERVLGSRHVARRRREIGDELAVALARHTGRDCASVTDVARRWEGALRERAGRGAQFCLRLRHFGSHGEIRRGRGSAAPVSASRRHVSGGERGQSRCDLGLRLRCWREAAGQVDQRPESDQRRQREPHGASICDRRSSIRGRIPRRCRSRISWSCPFSPRLAAHISQIGRTSIAPCLAPGQRAAQEIAASRSGASIRR